MKRLSNMDRKGGLHQANGHESSNASERCYVDNFHTHFHVHKFSEEGISITSKVTSTLGYSEGYSMDSVLLSLLTQSEA